MSCRASQAVEIWWKTSVSMPELASERLTSVASLAWSSINAMRFMVSVVAAQGQQMLPDPGDALRRHGLDQHMDDPQVLDHGAALQGNVLGHQIVGAGRVHEIKPYVLESCAGQQLCGRLLAALAGQGMVADRSEEHTSELQSQSNLVCRLL